MSSNYPTTLDSFSTKVDGTDYPRAIDINDVQDAIENIETKIGIDDSTDETSIDYMSKHTPMRSKFTYNGGSTTYTVKISPAVYYCKEKYCFWTSELTSPQISSPSANTWYYLYLDYSSITSSTELTNSNFIWSSTAPTFNGDYGQYLNTDDRCIFAVLSDSVPSNIVEFFHDGGSLILFSDAISVQALTDIDTTWTTVTLKMPAFSTKAEIIALATYVDGSSVGYWRTKGQLGATGHQFATIDTNTQAVNNVVTVFTNSSQQIEIKNSVSNGNQLGILSDGWYLPIGM